MVQNAMEADWGESQLRLRSEQPAVAASIIQSLKLTKSTGKLLFSNRTERNELFVYNGVPVHCVYETKIGPEAFVAMFNLDCVIYEFWGGNKPEEQTIFLRSDDLMMKAISQLNADNLGMMGWK